MKVKGLKGEKVKGLNRKRYMIGRYSGSGFTCCGIGPDVWSDRLERELKLFLGDTRTFAYLLVVASPSWRPNGKRKSDDLKYGVFKKMSEVISAIKAEEGGAK